MLERSNVTVRDALQRLAWLWSDVKVHWPGSGGDCEVCGNYTPPGEEQFLIVRVGEASA